MKKVARRLGLAFVTVVVALVGAWAVLVRVPRGDVPALSAVAAHESLQSGGRARTFVEYAPKSLPANAPLVLALHGSLETGESMRETIGYELDVLADARGFVVVYPDGVGHSWNDCRTVGDTPAKRENDDDVGFLGDLIAHQKSAHGIDEKRVFAIGYSNGGQLAFRTATQRPDVLAAIATFGASWPSPEVSLCPQEGPTPRAMLTMGTDDPINPFAGGEVSIFGFSKKGTVLAAVDTAAHFAKRNGISDAPVATTLPHQLDDDATSVVRSTWSKEGAPFLVFQRVNGGGHVVPQAHPFPRILGRNTKDLDGPRAALDFFGVAKP